MLEADSVHSTPPENTSPLSPDNPPSTAAGSGLDGLYVPTDVAPEVLFQAIGRLRQGARDEIDRLLSFLDATDDPDLEDDETETDADREPSLAAPDAHGPASQSHWADGDRHDLEQSLGDDEPSLGWTAGGSFGMPLLPDHVDIEDEHDSAEPDVCGEPDLGSFDRMLDQEKSWQQRPVWVQEGEVDVLDAGDTDMPRQATEGLADA
jgi:hypothetical protein